MSIDIDSQRHTKVYTTGDGRAVIEQSDRSVVLSAEQILTVINELRVCYDYCATWKQAAQADDPATVTERQP